MAIFPRVARISCSSFCCSRSSSQERFASSFSSCFFVTTLLQPTYSIYAATKAAVESMASVLANELLGRNITINIVAPSPTATDLFLNGKPQEVIERLVKLAPLECLGEPTDIAAVVAFLSGPDGTRVNGQTLHSSGGII